MADSPALAFADWKSRAGRPPSVLYRHFGREEHALDLVRYGKLRISSSDEWRRQAAPLGDRREGTEEREIATDTPCFEFDSTGPKLLGHPVAGRGIRNMRIFVGEDNRARYSSGAPWFGICYSERLWSTWFREFQGRSCAVRIIQPVSFFEAVHKAAQDYFLSRDKLVFFDLAYGPVLYDREAYTGEEFIDDRLSYFRKDSVFEREYEYRQLLLPHVRTVDRSSFTVESKSFKQFVELVDPADLAEASWPSPTPK